MPAPPKPPLEEYKAQLIANGFPVRKAYEINANTFLSQILGGPFFSTLSKTLEEVSTAYSERHPEFLLTHPDTEIELLTKPYDSVIEKVYRQNVLNNRSFPDPPFDGWIDGTNFFQRLNDVIRGRIVCKYIDGPEFLSGHFGERCGKSGLPFESYPMNNASGYHSWHCYLTHQIDVIEGGGVIERSLSVELQITTQLAEVLTALTHHLYEEQRLAPPGRRDESWRWKPESVQFRSTYMGHTLHLLEGVILSLKNEVEVRNAAKPLEGDRDGP